MNGNQGNKSLEIKIERKSLNTQQNLRLFNFYHGTDVGAGFTQGENPVHIRVICKVKKRQHQYPEFGHKQGEIPRKPCQKVHLERKTG